MLPRAVVHGACAEFLLQASIGGSNGHQWPVHGPEASMDVLMSLEACALYEQQAALKLVLLPCNG